MNKRYVNHNSIWKRGFAGILVLSMLLSSFPINTVYATGVDGAEESAAAINEAVDNNGVDNSNVGGFNFEEYNGDSRVSERTGPTSYNNTEVPGNYGTDGSTDDAAGGENAGDESTAADESSLLPDYSVTPDSEVPAYEAYKGMQEWNSSVETEAMDNTYAITIATGESAGDSVLYFVVRYRDKSGVSRSQFVFPNLDGGRRSDSILRYKAGDKLDKAYGLSVIGDVHYKENVTQETPLDSWSVQDYIFQTEVPIDTVLKVELYLSKGGKIDYDIYGSSTGGTGNRVAKDKLSKQNNNLSDNGVNDGTSLADENVGGTRFVNEKGELVDVSGKAVADSRDSTAGSSKATADSTRSMYFNDVTFGGSADDDRQGGVHIIPVDDTVRSSGKINYGNERGSVHVIPDNDTVRYSGLKSGEENSVHVIPEDNTLRYAGVNTADPDAKYSYDVFNQDFVEDIRGKFKYDSNLETYYEYGSPNLYYCPAIYQFVTRAQYTEWKNNGKIPDLTPENRLYKFDTSTNNFYRDFTGVYRYDSGIGTFCEENYSYYGTYVKRYYDFTTHNWIIEGKGSLPTQLRYADYTPTFKEGVNYRYNPYLRIFEESEKGKFVYDPEAGTVYHTEKRVYYDIDSRSFFSVINTKKAGASYRYDDFDQDFIEDENGAFKYDSKLDTYYEFEAPNLYFCPAIYQFVTRAQYTEWKNNGVIPDITPDSSKKYAFDEAVDTFYEKSDGEYSFSGDYGTFYNYKITNNYYDFSTRTFKKSGELPWQARYNNYNPTFEEGVNYYYNVYTRSFEENAEGKFVYDNEVKTVYHTGKNVYYDNAGRAFVSRSNLPILKTNTNKANVGYKYDAYTQDFIEHKSGNFTYDDELETYYEISSPNLYYCPVIYQFVTKNQYTKWKNNGEIPDLTPESGLYKFDTSTNNFYRDFTGVYRYDSGIGTFCEENYSYYGTYVKRYYDFTTHNWIIEGKGSLPTQLRYADYTPTFKEGVNYRYNPYLRIFEESEEGKFVYDPEVGTVYHTEKGVYYDVFNRTFVEKDKLEIRYRYDFFYQDFVINNGGAFYYDKELDTYYDNAGLYFYPEKYEFIPKQAYEEWKDVGTEPDLKPDENLSYAYDPNTYTFYESEKNASYKYDANKKAFYSTSISDAYFDYNTLKFVTKANLSKQTRYRMKPVPEYKEDASYYFDVYTRTVKEDGNGKFSYDPELGTVYHTEKDVYYDMVTDKFVPKDKLTPQDQYDYWNVDDVELDDDFYKENTVSESSLSHKKSVNIVNKGIVGPNTNETGKGSWTIQGLSIYKVENYRNYQEYGLISGKRFLDFEGYMIADVVKRGSGSLTFATSGGVDRAVAIGGAEDNNFCDIVNYVKNEVKRGYAADSSLYSIRMDIADQLNAGIDAFANSDGTKLSGDNGIVEDIAIEMQYKDTHGWTRKVTLPFILNSYMAASKACGDDTILGFAGRGDTVAMQGVFPEFDRLATSPKIYLGNTARNLINEEAGIDAASPTVKMTAAAKATASDDISLAGMSLYKGGCMPYVAGGTDKEGNALAGATLYYVFENENPIQYYTTTDAKGRLVRANGNDTIKLVNYQSGSPLVASVFGRDRYMVTLKTGDKGRSGTKDDISIMFYYEKQDGTKGSTISYRVKQAATDFLGEWPTKTGGNYIETVGLGDDGDISFLIEAPDLKAFTGVDISLLGDDEWLMDNLIISLVDDIQLRRAYIKDENDSNYWVERQMTIAPIFSLKGLETSVQDSDGNVIAEDGGLVEKEKKQKYDDEGNPLYDDNGNPIYEEVEDENYHNQTRTMSEQFFTGGQSINISFNTRTVNDVRDTDYASVRYRMTFDQTGVDWGFAKKKISYDVSVKVAEDPEYDMGNGDSGSSNYFYFQLIFKNGNSGYVLANQQVSSDGFRSGKTETFTISVNRDYGDLTGVRIIPEDISSDSDPFDKLNIDTITVTQQTNGGAAMMYVVGQVGWIDIDYRDESEKASFRGQKARTAGEISKLCKVTDKKRVYNMLCEFTNLPWDNDYYQLEGSVMATVYYLSSATNKVETMEFDVVSRLASYMNKTAKSFDAATNPEEIRIASSQMKTISDPEWMFRPNTTDRFIMPPIADIQSLKSIVFTAQSRNGYPATWNIGKVCVSEIEENGGLQLNANEEYYRSMKTKSLCSSDGETVTVNVNIGTPSASKEIKFNDNTITWTAEGWATPVSRMPDSSDDKVNIFVYPSAMTRNIASSKVNMFFQYAIPFSQYMQKTEVLQPANSGTGDAVFYILGLSVKDFVSASTLGIQCSNSRILFNHAIVQHVRDDVVVNTFAYQFTSEPSAVITLRTEPSPDNPYLDRTEETLAISFGANTDQQLLTSENDDVAVAFHYKSTLDGGRMEYRSPYLYLTDLGISSISEGLFAEIDFNVPYVSEITGYSIAGYGNLKANVDAAAAVVYHVDKTELNNDTGVYDTVERSKRSYASFADSYKLTDAITKYKKTNDKCYGDEATAPIAVTFTTAEASNVLDSGTESKVQMTFNYTNYMGVRMTKTFVDVTPYIQGDKKQFTTNEDATVKFFIKELDKDLSLASVDIIPYNGKKVTTRDINIVSDDAVKSQNTDTAVSSNTTNDTNSTNSTTDNSANGNTTDGTNTENIQTTDNTNTAVSNMEETDEVKLLNKTLESMNASWTISGVICDIAWGEKIKQRPITQQFLGLEKGGTLRFNDITMTVDLMRSNGASTQVKDGTALVTVKPGESLSAVIKIAGSTGGYSAHAYKMFGEAGDEVPTTLSNITTIGFTFKAPTNISGGAEEYKIEIAPIDAPDMVYTIRVWVQSDQPTTEATTTEAPTTEKATEAPTTEAPTTETPTTEAPATEAPATEAPATEAPASEETTTP